MTDAALSPAVSRQSGGSGSSNYSSPATPHPPAPHPPGYTTAGTGNELACLSSPSGDVYLDQTPGGSLGLESLVTGMVEGRGHSPALSDLVPAVPLLPWSPRSGDSIMGQSPSLGEALTPHLGLDVGPPEDSLCDSSTGFPGLFSLEDGASVSSSSEGGHPAVPGDGDPEGQDNEGSNVDAAQDHTVSSTRPEALNDSSGGNQISVATSGDSSPWRYDGARPRSSRGVRGRSRNEVNDHRPPKSHGKGGQPNSPGDSIEGEGRPRRRHRHAVARNGHQDVARSPRGGRRPPVLNSPGNPCKAEVKTELKTEMKEEDLPTEPSTAAHPGIPIKDEKPIIKSEPGAEDSGGRATRAKRRGEGELNEPKKGRGSRIRKSGPTEEGINHLEEELDAGGVQRTLRGRHGSGASDSSSGPPTPQGHDSTAALQGALKRRRRGSRDSSASSRDASPPTGQTPHSPPRGSGGVHTRRSSSRDHAKKTRCSCCSGGEQTPNTAGRRNSGRAGRPNNPSTGGTVVMASSADPPK